MTEKQDEFLKLSGDSDFQGRADSIFGSLNRLEKKHETEISKVTVPRAPHHVPDHVLHPEKWTKYTLEDDGSEQVAGKTGDSLNKHVALSFLGEIRKRKAHDSRQDSSVSTESLTESDVHMSEKHVFSKSVVKHKMEVDEVSPKSQIVEGVNVMPEYVIGQSPAKAPKKERVAVTADENSKIHATSKLVSLNHLEDQEKKDNATEISKTDLDSSAEQMGTAKFAKRKVKGRERIRGRKSSAEDE